MHSVVATLIDAISADDQDTEFVGFVRNPNRQLLTYSFPINRKHEQVNAVVDKMQPYSFVIVISLILYRLFYANEVVVCVHLAILVAARVAAAQCELKDLQRAVALCRFASHCNL